MSPEGKEAMGDNGEVQYSEGKAGKGCKDRKKGMVNTQGLCRLYRKGERGNPTILLKIGNFIEIFLELIWRPENLNW